MESIYNAIARHLPLAPPSRMFSGSSQSLAADASQSDSPSKDVAKEVTKKRKQPEVEQEVNPGVS
jgi:hypothetical protein